MRLAPSNLFKPSSKIFFLLTVPRRCFFCMFCACHAVLAVHYSLVVTCWERANLLALLCVMFSCVFVTFPCGVLGQVWYLIVLIPDFCLLPYFHIGQIWVENSVSAIQHIGNRKKFLSEVLPPLIKLIFLHTVVVLHYTHHKQSRERAVKLLKNKLLLTLISH